MSSFVSKLVAASRRPGRWARRVLGWLLWLLAVLWLVVLALWLLLHGVILPSSDRWRPDIEAAASKAMGVSVRIGQLTVRSTGWMPVVEARDIRLLDAQGREALQLPQVLAAVSARSLLAWPPRLEQLYIDAPQLEVRRDRQGQLWVAGLPLTRASGSEDNRVLDWLLRQHEVALRGGRVVWVDEHRDQAPLPLTEVQGVLRNGLRQHELRIDVLPPAELGARLSVRARARQPLLARPSDWRRWVGQVYVEAPQARLGALQQRLALPLQLADGQGGLRAWTEFDQGKLREITLDLQLADVRLRLARDLVPLQLQSLDARLAWQRLRDGSGWSVRGLRFALPENEPGGRGGVWPASTMSLRLRHSEAVEPWQVPADLAGGSLTADRIDIALLAHLAAGLPLPELLRHLLDEREPRGQLKNVAASFQGPLQAPKQWLVEGEADQLALRPGPLPEAGPDLPHPLAQPGFEGATLRLKASERGGEARLRLKDGAVHWPGLLDADSLAVREAELPLRWQREGEPGRAQWRVQWDGARLETPELKLGLDGHWQRGEQDARPGGQIQLTAKAARAPVTAVPRHLPRLLPLSVRQYLGDALQGGELRDLRMTLKGAVADFPFRQGGGEFRVSARVQDGRYAYLPSHPADATRPATTSPWPALDGLAGEIRFENAGMQLKLKSGRTAGLQLDDVSLRIPDLGREPRLQIDGQWRGELAQALAFVRATPVNVWTGGALAQAQPLPAGNGPAPGPVAGRLLLTIPLANPEQATVRGQVNLPPSGVALRLRDDLPPFAQLRGAADFTERGVQLQRLQARFLGGELRLSGGSRGEANAKPVLYFEAEGQASSEGLRAAAREWPALATLAPHLSGQTDYQLRLEFKGEQPELELRSNLRGMASNLPEPLKKPAGEAWPLLLRVQPQDGGREAWGLQLANGTEGRPQVLQALLERQGTATVRGAIRLGSDGPVALPAKGVNLLWAAPVIDLDPWRRQLGGRDGAVPEDAWLPDLIELQTPALRVEQRRLTGVQAQLRLAANRHDWLLNLRADQAAGSAEYRRPPGQPPQVVARFARLSVPQSEAERVEQYLDDAVGALPMLDVTVDEFELRGRKLGGLRIRADGAAAGRDWTLQQLSLEHKEAKLEAKGLWKAADKRTRLDWTLEVADSGRWLDALGFSNTVRGGKGHLQGQLSWPGSPLSPATTGLDGQFSIAVEKGQFLRADPGVARLLGILSLQSLPRRLLFDWRDVFSGGFAFDEFAGDVRIQSGVASTRNLRMRGLQAHVLMEGSADLGAETTDLAVLVVPKLDAGGASLAYTAVNPAVGLTAFLAQWLLSKPIEAANTTHLRVSGPWSEPKVEKLDKPATPASAASSP